MEQLARIFLLLLVLGLVISLVRYGPAGTSAWIRAKFLGRSAAGLQARRTG